MAPLNPAASPFIAASSATPLVASTTCLAASATPLVSSASSFFPSSALSPASQEVLAGELAALERREGRHAQAVRRRQSQKQQQQCGDGRMMIDPLYMYQPQTFEEMYNYQQPQAQYQAHYQQPPPYCAPEQHWIPSKYPIPAQQRQTYQEIRGPANQSFVGNQPEPHNQNYVGSQYPPQNYAPPAQRAQPLRQFWDERMETTIYPPPPQAPQSSQPVQAPHAQQVPQMTGKQLRQMEGHTPMNETGMQMKEVVQVRQSDNTYERMAMAQYRASEGQRPSYVPRVPSEYQQYEQPVYVQQPGQEHRSRAAKGQLPAYVHKRELGEVPGYDGYSITPERKIVRPDRVFAQVEESPVPAGGPKVHLPKAESSPAHLRDHNDGIPCFNTDLSPTRRGTDDDSNKGSRNNEGYNLANELQQYHRRQHTTVRAGSGNASDGRYLQHQREFRNSGGQDTNLARRDRLPGVDFAEYGNAAGFTFNFDASLRAEEAEVEMIREAVGRKWRLDRASCDPREVPRRQQEQPAEALPSTSTNTGPTPSVDNFHEGTTAVASVSSATVTNVTMTSPRLAPTPGNRPTVEDLSFAPAATSPVRTYTFPYAPTTSSGQPLNLPGPRTNPLASISERVARGELVPGNILDPRNLATQAVVAQMEANARAAAAGGRGEITYMDRGKYWAERKKAGKNAWEVEGWKVGGERPRGPNEANKAQKTHKQHKKRMDGDGRNCKGGKKKKAVEKGEDGECKDNTKVRQSRYDDDERGEEENSEKW